MSMLSYDQQKSLRELFIVLEKGIDLLANENLDKNLSVEEIQDIVEDKLMASNRKDVARCYIRYRYLRGLVRESNTTDKTIFELLKSFKNLEISFSFLLYKLTIAHLSYLSCIILV